MSRAHTRNGPEEADDLKSKVSEVTDSVREVGSHLRDVGTHVRDAAKEQYENVRDAAKEQYENVRDRAAGYVDAGKHKAREVEEGVETYVQENPVHALLIAAGVGLLIGLLWRRR